jgi:hypothetical protein
VAQAQQAWRDPGRLEEPTPMIRTRRPRAAPRRTVLALTAVSLAFGLAACGDPGAIPDEGGATQYLPQIQPQIQPKAPPQARTWDNDADGREDLAWWSATTGRMLAWRMNGVTLAGTGELGTSAVRPFSLRSAPLGDTCADTVYRAGSTIQIVELLALGSTCQGTGRAFTFELPGWSLIDAEGRYASGDRNQLLFRNTVGTVAIWTLSADGTVTASGFPATAPLEWTLVDGRGDYDGDGRSDILWRNTAGTVAMWRMTAIDGVAGVAFFGTAPAASWTLAEGAGDYDGDGRSDLLWIDTSGQVVIWSLSFATQSFVARPLGSVGAGWRVLDGTVDLDGDRRSDIVWQNAAGEVVIWLMNGGTIKQTRSLGIIGAEWRLISRQTR